MSEKALKQSKKAAAGKGKVKGGRRK
jgi:hypothetical protein